MLSNNQKKTFIVILIRITAATCSNDILPAPRNKFKGWMSRDLNGECILENKNSVYQLFTEWSNYKNKTHYLLMSPSLVILRQLYEHQYQSGLQISNLLNYSGKNEHCPPKQKNFNPTSVNELGLCQYYFTLNYDPYRIPSTLAVAHCSCKSIIIARTEFLCEEEVYSLRVLRFNKQCQEYEKSDEIISLGCIPVLRLSAAAPNGTLSRSSDLQEMDTVKET